MELMPFECAAPLPFLERVTSGKYLDTYHPKRLINLYFAFPWYFLTK